jgi:hypothetical protein
MRLVISFFLSLIIYIAIVFLFLSFLLKKQQPQKEVLVHTAIIVNQKIQNSIKNVVPKKRIQKQTVKKVTKKTVKKSGSKTNVAKGGDVSFNDIFKNVKANVPTTPVKLKKSEMSRFKGLQRIEKNLKNVKLLNINISYQSNSNTKKQDIDRVIAKISKVWYEISDIPGEYAKINVINNNGNVQVIILDSNLNDEKQIALINMIKSLKFEKNFNLNILFQTKVNK